MKSAQQHRAAHSTARATGETTGARVDSPTVMWSAAYSATVDAVYRRALYDRTVSGRGCRLAPLLTGAAVCGWLSSVRLVCLCSLARASLLSHLSASAPLGYMCGSGDGRMQPELACCRPPLPISHARTCSRAGLDSRQTASHVRRGLIARQWWDDSRASGSERVAERATSETARNRCLVTGQRVLDCACYVCVCGVCPTWCCSAVAELVGAACPLRPVRLLSVGELFAPLHSESLLPVLLLLHRRPVLRVPRGCVCQSDVSVEEVVCRRPLISRHPLQAQSSVLNLPQATTAQHGTQAGRVAGKVSPRLDDVV